MSDISEDCHYAGWLGGTEYFVPELRGRAVESVQPQFCRHGVVTPELARELVALAERGGSWPDADYSRVGYEPFDQFPTPLEYV